MVQLSMLADVIDDSLEAIVCSLGERALDSGVGSAARRIADRACMRKFSEEYGAFSLTAGEIERVRAYHMGVLRREVYRSGRGESVAYRERLRVLSAVQDLVSGGVPPMQLRPELIGTLGMDKRVVDRVLDEMAGAA